MARPRKHNTDAAFVTVRFHAGDARDLSTLAAIKGVTISDVYRELCSQTIRTSLLAAVQAELDRVKTKNKEAGA